MFKKGQSGNPSGRKPVDPKIKKEVDRILQAASVDAAQKLVLLAQNSYKDDISYKACVVILERVFGKPQQQIDLAGEGGGAIVVNVSYPTKKLE